MSPLVGVAWIVSCAILLLGPVVTAVTITAVRQRHAKSLRTVVYVCLTIVALVVGANFIHMGTMWEEMNFAFVASAYLSYCILAALCWTVKPLALRIPLGVVAYIPLAPGYVLGTVGILALGFLLGDYLAPPLHVENLRPGLLCRTTGWGAAFSDEGYAVHLYRYPPLIPVVRVEVKEVVVDESNPDAGPATASCQSVAASL